MKAVLAATTVRGDWLGYVSVLLLPAHLGMLAPANSLLDPQEARSIVSDDSDASFRSKTNHVVAYRTSTLEHRSGDDSSSLLVESSKRTSPSQIMKGRTERILKLW